METVICPVCAGRGEADLYDDIGALTNTVSCSYCGGAGQIEHVEGEHWSIRMPVRRFKKPDDKQKALADACKAIEEFLEKEKGRKR